MKFKPKKSKAMLRNGKMTNEFQHQILREVILSTEITVGSGVMLPLKKEEGKDW